MINKLKIIDTVRMTLRDKDGNIKSDRIVNNGLLHRLLCMLGLRHNSISKYGMAQVAALILTDVGGTAYDFIGIGNGTTAANVNDSALESEVKIKAATGIRNQTTYANDTAQLTATFSSSDSLSGTSAITEVVVTTAASAGIILCRQVYSPADNCNWDAGDTLQVTVKIQIKQGS